MGKSKKEPKRRPKYGLFSCVGYLYRFMWKSDRRLLLYGLLVVPVMVTGAALNVYVPSWILSVMERSGEFGYAALVIAGLLLARFLAGLVNEILEIWSSSSEIYIVNHLNFEEFANHQRRDWYHQYLPEVQRLDERGGKATENHLSAGVHLPMEFSEISATILNFLLFGGVVSMLHPMIALLSAVFCVLTYVTGARERAVNYRQQDARNAADKRVRYFRELSGQYRFAKDIRLYRMQEFLHTMNQRDIKEFQRFVDLWERRSLSAACSGLFFVFLRDGLAYGFLIFRAVSGELSAAEFVLYFNAITALSDCMTEILNRWGRVAQASLEISDYREDLEIADRLNHGKGIPVPKGPFSIEFRNVSYRYPEGEKQILNQISFRIEAGEKIALVGLNGAGKTTLTMLMCGLLLPDEGEVLIDGHPLTEYNRDELYGLFGLVPQNYNLLPMSIARNVACTLTEEEVDRTKLWDCLTRAGLAEKIRSLPRKEETPLYREIYEDAVDLSGGEKQRLLLARMLYKNPPCMILDEPTAALDPIAESRMYLQYREIAANATSVFISHRLASTRFCDRIFLLDGADFVQEGTHDELMAVEGRYRELFVLQSRYYAEGGAEDGE